MKKYLNLKAGFTPLQTVEKEQRAMGFVTGFTFLEVLATLVILSVALIPILTWVPLGIQSKIKAEQKTAAIFLCQAKLEDLHYQIIKNFTADYSQYNLSFGFPYQDFRYTVTDDLNSNLKTLSVEVWHAENPEDETVFYTQVARR